MTTRKPPIKVVPGQIWADKYPGSKGRTVRIIEVGPTHATVEVVTESQNQWARTGSTIGRQTRVSYDHRGLNGYRLESEPEVAPIDYFDGPVHAFFGLTYSSYQVVPRVLAQSMPHEWQARFVQCMEEMQAAFGYLGDISYDVRTAEEVYADALTEEHRVLTGVTGGWDAYQDREIFWDRDGNEIPGYQRVMVPVPDPLPSYSRGRTRVPRADQLPAAHSCSNCEGVDPTSCSFNTERDEKRPFTMADYREQM